MSWIDAADVDVYRRGIAAQGVLARSGALVDLANGVGRRGLVLLACDEVRRATDIGDLHVDDEGMVVAWQRQTIALTMAEFRILCCLIERAGTFVPSRQIYDAVHGPGHHVGVGGDGHCNATRVHIKRIRRKFRAVDCNFDQIETWYSHGYRWRLTA